MLWRTSIWLIAMLAAATSKINIPASNAVENYVLSDEVDTTTTTTEGDTDTDGETTTVGETESDGETTTVGVTTDGETESDGETTTVGVTNDGESETDGKSTTTAEPITDDPKPNTTEGDECDDDDSDNDLIVTTKSGRIQGFPWLGNCGITGFYDIPYGTFSNSLQPATAVGKWNTIHNVQDHGKRCPQLQGDDCVGDTDCLTLSIFKPRNAENASVLFHIHADLTTGSGDPSLYGPEYLVSNGIILVLPNYRVGPLGFLCMQNETAPGNTGLKDLSLALGWVHENIEAFDGNPNNIAVSGEGRSGALAGLLALSPMSKGNINKVIAESGSFLSYLSLDREPKITATKLLDRIKEATKSETRNDISLDTLDVREIVKASKDIEFKPCLEAKAENAFMVEPPFKILSPEEDETKEKEKIEISFLIGSAMYAGTHEALSQTEASIKELNDDSSRLLPNDLSFNSTVLRDQAANSVRKLYFGEEPIGLKEVNNRSLYYTDIAYLGPGIRSARLLVEAGATVYFYEFAFAGEYNRELNSMDRPVEGAVRGDIIGYLFTQEGNVPDDEQINERRMVGILTLMWTNFLNTGEPSTDSLQWDNLKAVEQEKEEWLLIDNEPRMMNGLHHHRMSLWTEIYKYHFIDNHSHQLSPSLFIYGFLFTFWIALWRIVS